MRQQLLQLLPHQKGFLMEAFFVAAKKIDELSPYTQHSASTHPVQRIFTKYAKSVQD